MTRKVLSLKGLFLSSNAYFVVECSTDSGSFSDFGLPIHSLLCHSQLNYLVGCTNETRAVTIIRSFLLYLCVQCQW